MADFDPKKSYLKKKSSKGFRKGPKKKDFGPGRERKFRSKDPRNKVEMTKAVCASCGLECEVPFRPKTDKPIYCSNCYSKNEKGGSSTSPDLSLINKKLDKIMKALKIE